MNKKRNKKVIIGERDRALFSYLYECKIANAHQICRDVFQGVSQTVFYRRASKLLNQKHLKCFPYSDGKSLLSGYSLSKFGLQKFIFDEANETTIKRCLSNSIEHDITLVDIRHRLMSCNQITDYYSENLLQSYSDFVKSETFEAFRSIRCDGVAECESNDKKIHLAIEYEHSLKFTNRYHTLFWNYYHEPNIHLVLYICRDNTMRKRITEIEKRMKREKQDKIFFTTKTELLSSKKSLIFTSSSGSQIELT